MKRILLLPLLLIGNMVHSDMEGLLSQVLNVGGLTSYLNSPYLIDKAMYTPGGLTFTFPTGIFPQDPYVFIGLVFQGSLGFISNYTYSSYNKSVSGITVKVYDALGLEIGSGLVEVHIFATCSDPNGLSILVN